jgi:hypothetical protein
MNAGAEHRFWQSWTEHGGSPTAIESSSMFDPTVTFRKLSVLIDEVTRENLRASEPDKAHLLDFLLALPQVFYLRYRDHGPSKDVIHDDVAPDGRKLYRDWAIAHREGPEETLKMAIVSPHAGTYGSASAVSHNFPESAARDVQSTAYSGRSRQEAAQLRRRSVEALRIADAVEADLFITDRAYLFEKGATYAMTATPMTPEQAIAMISLFLRAQKIYPIDGSHGSIPVSMNRGLFFWVGTRELLPAAWRWFGACAQHSHGTHDNGLLFLGQSALQRVERTLRLRDEVHIHVNRPQNQDVTEDVLENLDAAFLALMGTFDAAARVAHRVLQIAGSERAAGWQREGWLGRVTQAAGSLGALCSAGVDGHAVLNILSRLRNTVHGEALQARSFRTPRMYGTLIAVPPQDTSQISAAMIHLGGLEAWGVQEIQGDQILLDNPGLLLESLVERSLVLLNRLMTETPVEGLAHVAARSALGQIPSGEPWSESTRHSIRWQLGL